MNEVLKRIRKQNARIISQELKMECTIQVLVGVATAEILKNQLEKLEGVQVDC